MPALLTRMRGTPSHFCTACAAASIDCRLVMSMSARTTRSVKRSWTATNAGDAFAPGRSSAATRAPASSKASTQMGPSLPQLPVTTATWPSRLKRSLTLRTRELRALLGQHVVRQEVVFVQRLGGDHAEHAVELVGRNAAARRLHHDVGGGEHVPARQVARHHEALAHLDDRRLLALVDF